MTAIKAHFDGTSIVPDEPIELRKDIPLFILVGERRPMTAQDILESDLVGLWKDRADIPESPEYARQLREQAESFPAHA